MRMIPRLCLTFSLLLSSKSLAQITQSDAPERFFPEVFNPAGTLTLTPGFSPDGKTMYFAQTDCLPIGQCPQRLKRSTWTGSTWTTPQLVTLPIDARVDYPSVTPDGRYLLFSWQVPRKDLPGFDVDGNFDLWRLDLTTSGAEPEPIIGPDIARVRAGNVRTLRFVNNETAPNLTVDGDLYFWSERLDAVGERDVFVAKSDGKGGFLAPVALPAPVNSSSRDNGSWVSADGRTMLINYSDRGGCGGSDLFITYRDHSGKWRDPQNLGCEINSSAEEYAGVITPDGQNIVFISNRVDGVLKDATFQMWSAGFSKNE